MKKLLLIALLFVCCSTKNPVKIEDGPKTYILQGTLKTQTIYGENGQVINVELYGERWVINWGQPKYKIEYNQSIELTNFNGEHVKPYELQLLKNYCQFYLYDRFDENAEIKINEELNFKISIIPK